MKITNNKGIALPMAIWLLNDEYDYQAEPNYISATTLMKPVKQIILGKRVPATLKEMDISDLIAARLGTSLHDSLEKAINNHTHQGMNKLGYPQDIIDRVLINPEPEQISAVEDPLIFWTEIREKTKVGNWVVGGKFDLIAEGIPQDYKSTSAYTWLYGGRTDDYRTQLSIYKWQNPNKATEDIGIINFIFTDWRKSDAAKDPNYPQSRLETKTIKLWSIAETQAWVEGKLRLIDQYKDKDEKDIPECTDEELWRPAPQYKYYSDPAKTDGRSTRNFDTLIEASDFKASKGVGIVKVITGEPKRCAYCHAKPICKQSERYEQS